jgi:hypothetical protein
MVRPRTLKFIAVALWAPLCMSAQKKSLEPAISPLSSEMKAAMTGKSWKQGCPVSLDDAAAASQEPGICRGVDSDPHARHRRDDSNLQCVLQPEV